MTARAPAKLGVQGRKLWSEIADRYELRPDETRILTDVCREADIIERLEAGLRDAPLVVEGARGQTVANPLVSELRQHRAALTTMLKALHLPDTDDTAARRSLETSQLARRAARARWDRRTGPDSA